MPKSNQTIERTATGKKPVPHDAKDRVRRKTASHGQENYDSQTQAEIQHHVAQRSEAITRRIEALDREWPIDRALTMGVGFNLLLGILPGRAGIRTWYLFPAVVGGFLLLHALQGWFPPLPILRRLGFRTSKEIEREKLALKAILGDFRDLGGPKQ